MNIIRYAVSRKLYLPNEEDGTQRYITLSDIIELVKDGKDFTVRDYPTLEDITADTLIKAISTMSAKHATTKQLRAFIRSIL